ncbi:MAG TPA: NAD-dependent epimerase/dehydratase family protein [Steroidobacteraceae bacterium]|nr:NAD-dependent epimerase/dehydratase family protein [Steroidobacteraceae bacterium]
MMTRRESLKWAAAGLGVLATGVGRAEPSASKPLNLLILGGTGFLGPHQVEHALARGHRITLFNRGRSGPGLYGDRVEVLIGNRDRRIDQGLTALEGARRWDAVIDNSGYLPRHVRDSATLLKDRVGRYLYVSTVAVYDPSGGAVIDESSPLRSLPDPSLEEMSWANYGPQKAECDRVVRAMFGERATIVRPTYIVGPGDDTDRFTYWVERAAQGGDLLGPPEPEKELQWVDVRDLCPWIVSLAERNVAGVFTAAGPATPMSWEQTLKTLAIGSAQAAKFHWATAEVLEDLKIELPLVTPGRPSRHFANEASRKAGLDYRPLPDTAKATLEWWRAQPEARRVQPEGWPSREHELQAIARVK